MGGREEEEEAGTFPHTASSQIENGAILMTAMLVMSGILRVVFHATGDDDNSKVVVASLTQLWWYLEEVYSMAWDAAISIHQHEWEGKGGVKIARPDSIPPRTCPSLPRKERLSHVPTSCECATTISSPRGVGAGGLLWKQVIATNAPHG